MLCTGGDENGSIFLWNSLFRLENKLMTVNDHHRINNAVLTMTTWRDWLVVGSPEKIRAFNYNKELVMCFDARQRDVCYCPQSLVVWNGILFSCSNFFMCAWNRKGKFLKKFNKGARAMVVVSSELLVCGRSILDSVVWK